MMNIGSSSSSEQALDGRKEPDLDIDCWFGEHYNDDYFGDPMLNFGVDELMAIYPNQASQQNITATNSGGSASGGGSAEKSQSGNPQEMMTVNSLSPNNGTFTQQRAAHILTPMTNYVSNPSAAQSSQSPRGMGQPQFPHQSQPLRQVYEHMPVQQPPTHPSMAQPTIMYGHQNINQWTPSQQIRPCQRPVSTIQMSHLQNQQPLRQQSGTSQMQQRHQQMVQPMQNFHQNQNQMHMQIPQPMGPSHILIPEGGRMRVPGVVIGEGQRRPQEHRQGISAILSTEVGFLSPNEFSSNDTWREYAFRQVIMLRERYINELIKMHKKASHLSSQETNMEAVRKYEHAKEFLEKMITFLNISTVDAIPKNSHRVYNYMNFIVNYMTSFRIKNGGSTLDFDQVNDQIHQPSSTHSQEIANLEANMGNMNQQPAHHPNGDHMNSQYMLPPNPSQGMANREANMMNFNQNFPSRRPHGRSPASFQLGPVTPLRIGSLRGTPQHSNLGPRNNNNVNLSGSSMSLLKSSFPSTQPNHHQSVNSEKMKQPMHKSNELTGSNMSQVVMTPLGPRLQNQLHSSSSAPFPILQQAAQHSVSSWQLNANNVLSPQSIARSPFLLGSSSAPSNLEKNNSSCGASSLTAIEGQRPQIPILAGLRNQEIINNKVPENTDPPRAPMSSPMDTPCTEKGKESQDLKDPHLRLLDAVKSLSSKKLGCSIMDIGSVKDDLDSIPSKPVGGDFKFTTNFLLNSDDMESGLKFDFYEPANLDHLDLLEETAFLLQYKSEPYRKVKRKLTIGPSSPSLPDFCDDVSFESYSSEDWNLDSTLTSPNKKPKIECKRAAILEEIIEINSKLLETSLEMVVVESPEDKLKGQKGILVTCQYRNVCFPDLFRPEEGASSQMRPEFRINLLVPLDYPASSPIVKNGSHNILGGPCVQLFEETMSKFDRSVRELPEKASISDMARRWDASARSVFTKFAEKRGGQSFSTRYGTWESSSGSS